MDAVFEHFAKGQVESNGYELSKSLSPSLPNEQLRAIWKSCNTHSVKGVVKRHVHASLDRMNVFAAKEDPKYVQGWIDVYTAYWKAVGDLHAARDPASDSKGSQLLWTKVYESWRELLNTILRGYNSLGFEAWTIPCLYVVLKHLREFALKADFERNNSSSVDTAAQSTFQDDFNPESDQNRVLEDCARQLNRAFNACLTDRSELENSRKIGIYYVINLLFKTYFKLNSASLSKNVLKALQAGRGDMLPLEAFPKSQQVTFKYYEGLLCFLEENYVQAEEHLTQAWNLCHKDALRNKELILTYLVPCHLLTTHTLPSRKLLEPYPRLQKLFLPLAKHIKKGELHAFDLDLLENEDEFVRRRIYLTLERGRDIALRNLLRKVFIVGGFEEPKAEGDKPVRRTRIPIAEFAAAISLGSQETIDNDEVECFLANMIYKGLMKGYIARERSMVVLSKSGAFPGTGV
ncbi:protein CSN12 [Echria macrotheca]|uniref:Protein CSN12 homolog n=1 Tax=Echria macrotheca TaxID=438768 RepID=A0AAJ0F981_9PEZI|nr:protein CSN12 [Echria macrotheca]